jgi:hypothetical protein
LEVIRVRILRPDVERGSRPVLIAVLVVLACLLTVFGTLAVGVQQLLFNTDRWVAVVGPLAEDPAVQDDVANAITDATVGGVDTRALAARVLPAPAQGLAARALDAALTTFVHDQALRLVQSPQFSALWIGLNRTAQPAAVAILRGQTPPNVDVRNGEIRLDLVPLIAATVQRLTLAFPDAVSAPLALPAREAPPGQIQQALSTAFGRALPDGFGEVTVFRSDQLATAQQAVRWIDRLTWAIVVAALVLIAVTLIVSENRWRTAMWLGIGTMVGILLARLAVGSVEGLILSGLTTQPGSVATRAAIDAAMSSLLGSSVAVLVMAALVTVVAFVAGGRRSAPRTPRRNAGG